jgi:hypothetical protein
VRGLNLSSPVSRPDNLVRIATGSYRLLPYALEFWIEHWLQYASAGGVLDIGQFGSTSLSQLHDTHEQLSENSDPDDSSCGSVEAMEDHLDHRLKLFAHMPVHDLMRRVLHARKTSSQQQCETWEGKSNPWPDHNWYTAHTNNTLDIETFIIQSDSTKFSKLLAEFDRAVVHLLSQSEVAGISRAALATFQESYASTAFRCRYPYCTRASAGFASAPLRDQHEAAHFQRVYFCKEASCQYSRIGFAKKNKLILHTRDFHNESPTLPIPSKVRRSKENAETDIESSISNKPPTPGTFHA